MPQPTHNYRASILLRLTYICKHIFEDDEISFNHNVYSFITYSITFITYRVNDSSHSNPYFPLYTDISVI